MLIRGGILKGGEVNYKFEVPEGDVEGRGGVVVRKEGLIRALKIYLKKIYLKLLRG